MGARKPRYFMLYYIDGYTKTFNVDGPITSDLGAGQRTCELRKSGRDVRICTTSPQMDIKKVPSIQDCINRGPDGYKYDSSLSW